MKGDCKMREECTLKDPILVDAKHLKTICIPEYSCTATCCFLVFQREFKCAKGSNLHSFIESRKEIMSEKGNNCSGPPDFKSL